MAKLDRMCNGERGMGRSQASSDLGRPSVEAERGPSAGLTDHLDLQPAHAEADAGPQSLGPASLAANRAAKLSAELRLRRQ